VSTRRSSGRRWPRDDLLALSELMESGAVRTVIDRTYPLAETAEAMRYLGAGHAQGKVVVTV
jgi:NADPH:quinone reductase-like Zn-dependent oxidoreductase